MATWNDAPGGNVEQLKALWTKGLSCSQIAAELVGGFSRNAVIGKVHRLGLSGRAKSPLSADPRKPKAHVMRVNPFNPKPVAKPKTAVQSAFDVEELPAASNFDLEVPMSQRLGITELDETKCHWPVGTPGADDFFFCGGKALLSLPYCGHHTRIAYQPAADRRSRRNADKHYSRSRL